MTPPPSIFGDRLLRTAERVRDEEQIRALHLFERGRTDRRLGLPTRSLEPDYRRGYLFGQTPRPRLYDPTAGTG